MRSALRAFIYNGSILFFIMALMVAGCGPKATSTVAPEATKPPVEGKATEVPAATEIQAIEATEPPIEEVELVVWTWVWENQQKWVNQRIEVFEQQNPNVTIKYETFPSAGEGNYGDKILATIATGEGPDVFFIRDTSLMAFASTGSVLPIDEKVLSSLGYSSYADMFSARGWTDHANDGWLYDGQYYGLANEVSWLALFINEDCMTDSGLDPLTTKVSTWDDLMDVSTKMVRFDNNGNMTREGFDLPVYTSRTWFINTLTLFLAQTGGSVISEDGMTATINSPEAVGAIELMLKLHNSEGSSPDFGSPGVGGQFQDFLAGNICAVVYNPAMAKTAGDSGAKIVSYGVPTNNGKEGNYMGGWAWQVNANSKHTDLAWKFIDVLTLDTEAHCEVSGFWIPVEDFEGSECIQSNPAFEGFAISMDQNPQFTFKSAKYPEIERILMEAYESMLFDGSDIMEALNNAASKINSTLAE